MIRIVFSGGETLGPVMPLLAVWEEIKRMNIEAEVLWVATQDGVENELLKIYDIPTQSIVSGKFRRYFSLKNFFDIFKIIIGFFQSIKILRKFHPTIVISAGGYVSVPLIWAARFLAIPTIIHQQDIHPSLSNKLCAWYSSAITVAFEKSLQDFPNKKTLLVGNPVRNELFGITKDEGLNFFKLKNDIPVVLIMGGGTGSLRMNQLVLKNLAELVTFCQVIHVTGRHKTETVAVHERYRSYEILGKEIKFAYAASDLVVSRAGLSTISELAALRKATIVIPIPGSQQEHNATFFSKNNAILKISQDELDDPSFVSAIRDILTDASMRQNLERNMSKVMLEGATERMVDLIMQMKSKNTIS